MNFVEAIRDLEVLGGYSRSYGIGEDGTWEPDRNIETLGHYITTFALRKALEYVTNANHYVNGLDGVITGQSRDVLMIAYEDGSTALFKREIS